MLAVQYAILAVLVVTPLLRRRPLVAHADDASAARAAAWRGAGGFLVSSIPVAAAVAFHLAGTALGHKYGRNPARIPATLKVTWDTFLAFSSGNRLLLACLLLVPLPLAYALRRRRELLPVVLSLQLVLLAIPAIVELARWKRYYFHPRHALFLLPAVEILTAIALLGIVRAIDPAALATRHCATARGVEPRHRVRARGRRPSCRRCAATSRTPNASSRAARRPTTCAGSRRPCATRRKGWCRPTSTC